ncbi:hypothetical protein BDN72DRAFT_858399 [Pluteus cervinus]|uniref:Uncharacterized protein n=1 Tax=Pluteus cervinus TaxID=181527 RepID=A0ACD3ARY0_9AGAR|nr:hypothetical protein BDN72DRAFT_858399 [Pluteus cervinus]
MSGTTSSVSLELHVGSVPMGKPTRSIPTCGTIADHLSPRIKGFSPLLGGYLDLAPPSPLTTFSDSIIGLTGPALPLDAFASLTKLNCSFDPFGAPLDALSPIDSDSGSEFESDENTPPSSYSSPSFCTPFSADIIPEPRLRFNRAPFGPLLELPVAETERDIALENMIDELAVSVINSVLDPEDRIEIAPSRLRGLARLRQWAPPVLQRIPMSEEDIFSASSASLEYFDAEDDIGGEVNDENTPPQVPFISAAAPTTTNSALVAATNINAATNSTAPLPFTLTGPATIKEILARRTGTTGTNTSLPLNTTSPSVAPPNTNAKSAVGKIAHAALQVANILTLPKTCAQA